MRTVLAAVAAVTAMTGMAFAAGADRDGDGKITRAELAAVHASLFDELDANKDGFVTQDEADPHFMDLADQDRDGAVTKAENEVYASEAAERDLAHCDEDGDDALSGAEIECIAASDSFNE